MASERPGTPAGGGDAGRALRIIEHLEREVEALRQAQGEPIALVGMSCRFPGADSPDQFWSLLERGEESTSEVPRERWDIDSLYDPDPDARGRMSTRYGGFLRGVDQFDAAFFSVSPREAALMDPQQRLLLELSWEALERAALSPDALYGSPTGVFVGICASDYFRMAARSADNLTAYIGTGNAPAVAAGRISYTFGFSGPCMSIDTACSSALVAVHYAVDSLRKRECDVALAASVNLTLAPEATIAFSKARMMAPDGRCKTFDERADGYVRSEGGAVVVLKRLSAARADGDRILALIRGSSVNQDGASGGLTVPNGPSQVALIRQALARAGVEPEEIDYVETHGTGTALGDPIEVGALAEVFAGARDRRRPLRLGSAKAVVGHLEIAAGMAGLIKVVLALQNETIPGHVQLGQLSSRIPWDELPFAVPRAPEPWVRNGRPRTAGVSAFGFSGTNAHLVVQEPPAAPPARTEPERAAPPQPSHLLVLSARTPPALVEMAGRHAAWLEEHPRATLDEVCWTAATGRAQLGHRLAIRAADPAALRERLAAFAREPVTAGADIFSAAASAMERPLGFLFTGQGAQYAGMGRELHDLHPHFRATIDRCEQILAAHLDEPLREVMWGAHTSLLNQTAYTQPALVALEVALASLWQRWGVQPSYVMGHSVGEIAAACVAGIFSLEDALRLGAARGRLMQGLPMNGAMAVVLAGRDAVAPAVERFPGRLSIAACNAPDQTVISGERAAVLEACESLARGGVRNRGLLDVSHAFHSPLMEPIVDEFRAVAESVRYARPAIGVVSNVSGRVETDGMSTPEYWVEHVRAPVDFMSGVRELEERGVETLLEIGPSAALIGLARACAGDRLLAVASLRPKGSDWSQMLACLGTLAVHGHGVDWRWAGRCEQAPPVKQELPHYPFQRQRYWFQDVGDGDAFGVRSAADQGRGHPLLGRRLRTASLGAGDLLYEGVLGERRQAYLKDHRVYDKVVVPAAAYVEMALAGVQREFAGTAAVLRGVSVQSALVLPKGGDTLVQALYSDAGDSRYRFQLFSTRGGEDAPGDEGGDWRTHVTGEIELVPAAGDAGPALELEPLRRRFEELGERLDVESFYERYASLGLSYGPAFRSVAELHRVAGTDTSAPEVLARIRPPDLARERLAEYILHPTLLDGCLQAVGALVEEAGVVCLPVGIESLRAWRSAPEAVWAHAVLRPSAVAGDPRVVADLRLVADDGAVVCALEGLQAVPVERRALAVATATWKDKLYAVKWVPEERARPAAPAEEGPARARWLVVSDRGGVGRGVRDLLEARGHACSAVGEDELDVRDRSAWTALLAERASADPTPLAGIVHLLALDEDGERGEPDGPPPEASQARLCGSALALVQALMDTPDQRLPRVWLVTRGAQAVSDGAAVDVAQAPLWGLGRTIALEHPSLQCTCLDLEPGASPGAEAAGAIVAEIAAPDAELQIAHRDGKRHVGRLSRMAPPRSRRELPRGGDAYQLRTAEYGSLDRLSLVAAERRAPGEGEVEIEVRAAAINFKDVLHCLGMLREFSERAGIRRPIDQPLGFECAGRIARVGAAVAGLAPGDEVFAMAPSAMASHVTIAERHVHRKPRHLTFEQSASLPAAFMTAIYSLDHLAKVKPGDRVLVHACAGGVGQAAVQIARARGAIVYGTASPAKWSTVKRQGVAHVMSSRTLDFAGEIMRVTDGRGVDVVLNSLTGDFIARSADALAPGGRFVEIGKIGIWSAEQMAAHRPDVAYFSFDLGDVEGEGELQARLLADVVRELEGGRLSPLPTRAFSILEAEQGFRHLARARNIGKVVLKLPERGAATGSIRPDRSYLVTGGWGALGLCVAKSLLAGGARHLVLVGRSEPDERARAAIESLRAAGAAIDVAPVDVSDRAQVDALVRRVAGAVPLGGVVHAAGVLDDGTLVRQSWERFARVMAPKVAGSWNLHQATRGLDLDFFVLFSSAASLTGAPGQANYAAANAFLDGLAQHRRSHGLPATCIHWGPWAAAGMAERTRGANRSRFESFGLRRMSIDDNVEVFEHLLEVGAAGAAVLDVDWAKFLKMLRNPGAARFYALVDKGAALAGREEVGALLRRLCREPAERREPMLLDHLRGEIAGVVGLASPDSIDVTQPLLSIGFDSLMAVELKSRIESSLGCALAPTLLFDHPTLETLVHHLVANVLRLDAASGGAAPALGPEPAAEGGEQVAGSGPPEGGRAAPLAGMRESFVEAGRGRRLCLCSWGPDDAPLAVLVHGILDQAASWDEIAGGLVESGYRVIAPDLRGHGRSDHHPADASITAMDFLLDLTAVLADRGAARRPFVLVGHSIGAVVASLHASAYGDQVSHLVLVEPVMPALREQQSALDLLLNDLRYARETPAHAVIPDLRAAAQMLALNHRGLSPDRAVKLAERISEPCDGGLRWAWDARLRNPMGVDLFFSPAQYLKLLEDLKVGCTRIYGTTSPYAGTSILVPADDPDRHSRARSRSVAVPGGHNLHTEAPASVLREILADLGAARAAESGARHSHAGTLRSHHNAGRHPALSGRQGS